MVWSRENAVALNRALVGGRPLTGCVSASLASDCLDLPEYGVCPLISSFCLGMAIWAGVC